MIHAQAQKHTTLVVPVAAATSSAGITANLDTLGADYATITLIYNAEINTNAIDATVSVLESDDTTASNFATIVADVTIDRTSAQTAIWHVDTRTRKRYLRIKCTTGTTVSNDAVLFSAHAVSGRLALTPANTAAMVANTAYAVTIVP